MNTLLSSEFPPPRIGQLIASETHRRGNLAVNVRLTESYTLSHRTGFSTIANAVVTIAVVGLLLGGIPAMTIRSVASFGVGAGGVLFIVVTETFRVHRADEHWTRNATVHGDTWRADFLAMANMAVFCRNMCRIYCLANLYTQERDV